MSLLKYLTQTFLSSLGLKSTPKRKKSKKRKASKSKVRSKVKKKVLKRAAKKAPAKAVKKKKSKKTTKKKSVKKKVAKKKPKTVKKTAKKKKPKVSKKTSKILKASSRIGVSETPIGTVTHYFPKVKAAIVKITKGPLTLGEKIAFQDQGATLKMKVKSMQINHIPIHEARKGEEIGIQVAKPVREGALVVKVKG